MNMVTLTSTHNTSLPQTFPSNVDPSFSPYLSNKQAFRAPGLAAENFSPITTTTQDKHIHMGRNKEEDGEIGVFQAEKYFNGAIDDVETSTRVSSISSSARSYPYKNDGRLNLEQVKAKIQPRTPSVRSESSWNSSSVLLQGGRRNSSRAKSSGLNGKKFLATFGCKCSCSDKNSVETKNVGEISFNKSPSNASYKSSLHHKSRIMSPARPGLNLIDPLQIQKPPKVDILSPKQPSGPQQFPSRSPLLRKSPEVFGSPALQRGSKSLSLDRRLTMMSWDRPCGVAPTPPPPPPPPRAEELVFNANSSANHHDSGSDTSSDLFEIDSLTGKTNPFMARRTSDDQTSGCVTPTTGYAPSETSIQWSVVTASAADCSVMSDCEDSVGTRPASKMVMGGPAKTRMMSKDIVPRSRSSTLLGCKSQKAVNIAGDAYRATTTPRPSYDPNMGFRLDSPARFQAKIAKLTDFNTRVGQQLSLAQIPRLASPQNSHLLYSQ